MKIANLKQAEAALRPYVPLVKQLTGKDTTLERIRPLMQLLGNPQEKLKTVHIAGTSGKTSTAYYMAALLHAAGQKVGLAVSPHIDRVTERIQINGQPLSEREFCRYLERFLEVIDDVEQPPSYFELLYALAIWVFADQKVDYAVVETGLGGLFDATNVITRPDKLCLITDLGFDHTSILGKTLAEIASQKIGITHPGNTVLLHQPPIEAMKVITSWVEKQGATLTIVSEPQLTDTDLPAFQQRNWHLASAAYDYLANRDDLKHLTSKALQTTQEINIPGRMDIRHIADKTLVMDGAHNRQKMQAFIVSFRVRFPNAKPAVLLAVKEGKDCEQIVPLLINFADRLILTTFTTTQDLPVVSMDPQRLGDAFAAAGLKAEVIPDQHAAYQRLLATPAEVVVITGSFYLLSQLRNNEGI